MNWISILVFFGIAIPVLAFVVWTLLQDAFIRINPGEMGLIIRRGKPTDKGLSPGTHFALRFARLIEIYPSVELAYLTAGDDQIGGLESQAWTYADPPLPFSLGDGATGTLQYTIRFTLTPTGLPQIHMRFGPSGIKAIIRDESRRAIIDSLTEASITLTDTYSEPRIALEARLAEAVGERLSACGFAMAMFNLRDVDLAATGEVMQATVRAREELALEEATSAVRLAHAKHEAEVNMALAGNLSDAALRYMQIQVWRDLIKRWDGSHLLLSDRGLSPLSSTPPTDGQPEQTPPAP